MKFLSHQPIIPQFVLAVGIAFAGYFVGHAILHFKNSDRYVTVKGLAERTVKSDQAALEIQFNYTDDNLSGLYAGIAKAQQTIKDFLVAQGFSANNVTFKPVNITDNLSTGVSNTTTIKRFSASAGVVVTTNNVDLVQAASQKTGELVQKNIVVTQSNASYFYTQLNTIKPIMLNDATNNAKEAADSFAKNAHNHLGVIYTANQGLFTISELSGGDYSPNSGIMKKVRVVTTVRYFLR